MLQFVPHKNKKVYLKFLFDFLKFILLFLIKISITFLFNQSNQSSNHYPWYRNNTGL
jgi:hypothetical protein